MVRIVRERLGEVLLHVTKSFTAISSKTLSCPIEQRGITDLINQQSIDNIKYLLNLWIDLNDLDKQLLTC
jgi:hypothetical protein